MYYNPEKAQGFAIGGAIGTLFVVMGIADPDIAWYVPLLSLLVMGLALGLVYSLFYGLYMLVGYVWEMTVRKRW